MYINQRRQLDETLLHLVKRPFSLLDTLVVLPQGDDSFKATKVLAKYLVGTCLLDKL